MIVEINPAMYGSSLIGETPTSACYRTTAETAGRLDLLTQRIDPARAADGVDATFDGSVGCCSL
jgi:hypothetical protein